LFYSSSVQDDFDSSSVQQNQSLTLSKTLTQLADSAWPTRNWHVSHFNATSPDPFSPFPEDYSEDHEHQFRLEQEEFQLVSFLFCD
jgi:hypothetical protein